jgi:hypothetical protein
MPDSSPSTATGGHLGAAAGAGLLAAIVTAIAWALITVSTKHQYGIVAIAVGFAVGWAVRTAGGGRRVSFAVLGGGLALLGCVLGNLLSACGFFADARGVPLMTIIARVLPDPALAARLLSATFQPMDLLFYAIAVYEGAKLARPKT